MTRTPSPVHALRSRLGLLRHRIKALWTLQGLARWVLAGVTALALFFAADWLLDLPLGVRRFVRLGLLDRPEGLATISWVVLLAAAAFLTVWSTRRRLGAAGVLAFALGGIAGVLVWLGVRVFRPLARRIPDDDLALAVEQRYGALNDRLAAALDFEEELESPSRGESQPMMRAVLDEAAEAARGLTFARAVSARRALTWSLAAVGALGGAALLTAAAPDTVDLWARRSLLLEDARWPQATTLIAVDVLEDGRTVEHDASRPFEVTVGRPLVVHARALGRVPDEVFLLDQVEGARPLPRRMFPVAGSDGLFQLEIRDVRRPFAFVLRGGDDTDADPLYRVAITVPPRVLAMAANLTYPPYLARDPEVLSGGTFSVPEGTRVRIEFETDVPIMEARAILKDEVREATRLDTDGRRFAFEFTAIASLRYRILLRTASGRESDPAADTYEIRVAPDSAPRVQWIHPRASTETTPKGRVPLLAVVTDDHGVDACELEVRLGDDSTQRFRLSERDPDADATDAGDDVLPALDGPPGRPELRVYVPLDVADLVGPGGLPPTAPARLAVRWIARDLKGQEKESTWAPIDVYGAVDLERTLAGSRAVVRSEIASVLIEQRRRREQLAGLLGAPLGDAEQDLVKSVQFAQAKIAQDADQAVQGLLEIFNAWVYDRLGAENPTERILAIFDRHHRTTYGMAPRRTGEGVSGLDTRGDAVFPYALYDEIVAAWRDKVIFDTGLLDRMLAVVRDAVDLAARVAPAAHEAAVRTAARQADLETTIAAQDEVIVALERVVDAMRTWQSLNDLILQLRRILDEQEVLNERLLEDAEND